MCVCVRSLSVVDVKPQAHVSNILFVTNHFFPSRIKRTSGIFKNKIIQICKKNVLKLKKTKQNKCDYNKIKSKGFQGQTQRKVTC